MERFWKGDITVETWTPIKFEDPDPKDFCLKGRILRVDSEPRIISKRGGCFQVSINSSWIQHLPRQVKGHFFQTPKYRGIIFIGPDAEILNGGG
jgi:hypothetical protein